MPRLKKLIKDIELDNGEYRIPRTLLLSGETDKILRELAKAKISARELEPTQKIFSEKKIRELTTTWFKTGNPPEIVVHSIKRMALYASDNEIKDRCMRAFLEHHPAIKMEDRGRGRPPGYKSPEKKLRLAMGEVISDILNSNPNVYRKLLKAA